MPKKLNPKTCKHPANRRFCWHAHDAKSARDVCVGCCDCGKVLSGAATLPKKA